MPEDLKLFAYLNVNNPLVRWEAAIGRLRSVCDNPNVEGFGVSLWQYSLLQEYATRSMSCKILNEFRLEALRQQYYPSHVSRLKGLYFFESRDIAEDAIDRWNISQSKKQFISEVSFSAANLSRLDSEWITHYLGKQNKNEDWMHSYWKGETYGSRPLTEIIASGVGHIEDGLIRQNCYEYILKKEPLSSKILSLGASAYYCGFKEVAQVVTGLLASGNGINGGHFIYMESFKDGSVDFQECLDRCSDNGGCFPYHQSCDELDYLRVPDNRDQNFHLDGLDMLELFTDIAHGVTAGNPNT